MIKVNDTKRISINVTQELLEAVAKYFGIPIVEITNKNISWFVTSATARRVIDILE